MILKKLSKNQIHSNSCLLNVKKIIFMGTPMFAVPILKSLYQNGYFISAVYTQPPQNLKEVKKLTNQQSKEFQKH